MLEIYMRQLDSCKKHPRKENTFANNALGGL